MSLTSQDYPFFANWTTIINARGMIVCNTHDLQLAQDIATALNEKYQPTALQDDRITVIRGMPL